MSSYVSFKKSSEFQTEPKCPVTSALLHFSGVPVDILYCVLALQSESFFSNVEHLNLPSFVPLSKNPLIIEGAWYLNPAFSTECVVSPEMQSGRFVCIVMNWEIHQANLKSNDTQESRLFYGKMKKSMRLCMVWCKLRFQPSGKSVLNNLPESTLVQAVQSKSANNRPSHHGKSKRISDILIFCLRCWEIQRSDLDAKQKEKHLRGKREWSFAWLDRWDRPSCWIALSADHGSSIVKWILLLLFFTSAEACKEIPVDAASETMATSFAPFMNASTKNQGISAWYVPNCLCQVQEWVCHLKPILMRCLQRWQHKVLVSTGKDMNVHQTIKVKFVILFDVKWWASKRHRHERWTQK